MENLTKTVFDSDRNLDKHYSRINTRVPSYSISQVIAAQRGKNSIVALRSDYDWWIRLSALEYWQTIPGTLD